MFDWLKNNKAAPQQRSEPGAQAGNAASAERGHRAATQALMKETGAPRTRFDGPTLAAAIRAGAKQLIRDYHTSKGPMGFTANLEFSGKTLILSHTVVNNINAQSLDERLNVGTREMASLVSDMCREAKAIGFEKLRITGERVTGAKVENEKEDRSVDIERDLT